MLIRCFSRVREKHPLVECFANVVTTNGCANMLLAAGASPVMADDPVGAVEFTEKADALSINIGTFTPTLRDAIRGAQETALRRGIPVLLDPVGTGCAPSRTELSTEILNRGVSIVRCNRSEANALLGLTASTRGVDASPDDAITEETLDRAVSDVRALAAKYNCVMAVTGAIDLVGGTDGRVAVIRGGHEIMTKVTGSGCMLSALTAAYAGAEPNFLFEAAAAALAAYGVCGKLAYESLKPGEGCGTFAVRLFDAVGNLDVTTLHERLDYEVCQA
jgi:hydroxyethylthiazole kinase